MNFQLNQDELDAIVEKHSDMVYRIALMRVQNQQDAEDVMQDVFIKLCREINHFKNEGHVKAWLVRVTINQCMDLLKSVRRKTSVQLHENIAHNDIYEFSELAGAVKDLPEKYRTPVYLFYFENLSIEQIARATNMNANTVKTQLARARKMLEGGLRCV